MDERCRQWGVEESQLREFRTWYHTQHHMPVDAPNEYLAQFLHSCHYNLEEAKKAIEVYFKLKTNAPELFANRSLDNERIQKVNNVFQLGVMPEQTPEGVTVIFGRLVDMTPSHLDTNDSIKFLFMVVDMVMREHPGCPGILFVYDLQGYSFRHLFRLSLSTVKKYLEYLQDGCPMRHKGVHLFNASYIATHMLAMARPFIYQEHFKKIGFYRSSQFESITELVGARCIPKDYGGDGPSMDKLHDETLQMVRKHAEWYKFDETLKIIDVHQKTTKNINNNNMDSI